MNSTGAVFSGFTVVNGRAGCGGWILIGDYGGMVSNCVVFNNASVNNQHFGSYNNGGHGMFSYTTSGYTGYFYNCSIYNNTSISNVGGGGCVRGSGVARDCEFYSNTCILYFVLRWRRLLHVWRYQSKSVRFLQQCYRWIWWRSYLHKRDSS